MAYQNRQGIAPSASRILLLLGCLAGLTAASTDGWDAYASGRFTEAVGIWSRAAMGGDADAQFGLGLAYDFGQGVAQDEAQACRWYGRAGRGGVAAAAFNLAVLLDQGRCGARDAGRVAEWYGRAAAAGNPRAAYNLAQLYETGDGVPLNLAAAIAGYDQAASGGLTAAGQKETELSRRPQAPTKRIQPPLPTSPVDEAVPDRGLPMAFVWSAPAQPGPARFFLEVDVLHPDSSHQVVARYVDKTADVISLPPGSASYAWRVSAVMASQQHYAASPWQRFQVSGRVIQ